MHAYMVISIYVFFVHFTELRALKEAEVVPYGRVMDALLRHGISAVGLPPRWWRVIV